MVGNQSQFSMPTLVSENVAYDKNIDKANLIGKTISCNSSDRNHSEIFLRNKNKYETIYKSQHPLNNDDEEINEPFSLEELQKAIRQNKKFFSGKR